MSRSDKKNGFDYIMVGLISFLYTLFVVKLADVVSSQYVSSLSDDGVGLGLGSETGTNEIGVYVMVIYMISIVGIIISFFWSSKDTKSKHSIANWIVQWSLSLGGIMLLAYTIVNYWDFLEDYSKLSIITLSMGCIMYYLYKYY